MALGGVGGAGVAAAASAGGSNAPLPANCQRIRNRLNNSYTWEAPKSAPLPRKAYVSSSSPGQSGDAAQAEFVYLSREDLSASSAADIRLLENAARTARGESSGSSDNYRELRDIVRRIEQRRLDWERGHRERGRRLRRDGRGGGHAASSAGQFPVTRGKSFNGQMDTAAAANSNSHMASKSPRFARKKMYFDRLGDASNASSSG
jgi:hypothetical protein